MLGLIFTTLVLIVVEGCFVCWLHHTRLPDRQFAASGFLVVPPWCRKPLFEVTLLLMIAAGMLFQVSAQATALLDKAATEPNFRDRLETEARELTEIGNRFMIRHTEMDKVPIADSAHVDYLFQRMFALIRLLLKASGRGG